MGEGGGEDQDPWPYQRTICLYRSLIRSMLDYGSTVYGSAAQIVSKLLSTMHNEALHLASEKFKNTPIES